MHTICCLYVSWKCTLLSRKTFVRQLTFKNLRPCGINVVSASIMKAGCSPKYKRNTIGCANIKQVKLPKHP